MLASARWSAATIAVHRYLHRRVGRDLADDLAAETLARAFETRDRYVPMRDDALPWLYGIATNLVRGHRRSEERSLRDFATLGVDESVQFDVDRIADRVDAQRQSSDLAAVLLALPDAQRDAVCPRGRGRSVALSRSSAGKIVRRTVLVAAVGVVATLVFALQPENDRGGSGAGRSGADAGPWACRRWNRRAPRRSAAA